VPDDSLVPAREPQLEELGLIFLRQRDEEVELGGEVAEDRAP
jgi:hypothetical protein